MRKIGALEAGGTKMVLAVYQENGTELERITLSTEAPEITVPSMVEFFRRHQVDALGVGSFGPLDLNPSSPAYGSITSTPKLKWRDYPLLQKLLDGRDIPALIDTDVNAAALAEVELGAARGCRNAVYVTVGTGIGGGVYADGKLLHGLIHPELGHMLLRPHTDDPNPHGVCPYHDGCLEGLAAGPAIGARVQGDARELPDDHPTFAIEAHYLAQMCVNLILTLSPEKIILGGGVLGRECLLPMVRQETLRLLGGYVQSPAITEHVDSYIVAPQLFPVSGLVGSFLLGKQALEQAR
ncbi:MAG: ROK family protein [Clostridiales bacterium]|nr:ROK family protein [Clostridiales bacterium]